ncbi:hypothetical protein OIV83_003259 [Microbotryomycetes sp. JL201]|nr:hypothetical protein OIV83_003259 [Microbotryomycetes sp. JL201]
MASHHRLTLTRALEMQERDKDQLEIIALQREALASATELVAALQRRLRLVESTSPDNRPASTFGQPSISATSSRAPSAPPASTSLSAALRLQILGRGLQQTALARRVEEAESRSQSRHATPRHGMSPVTSDVEQDEDEDDSEELEDESDADESSFVNGGDVRASHEKATAASRERDYRLWIAEHKLAKGLVDQNGVKLEFSLSSLVASMSTSAQAALEASLKSTIHALSLVVSFHATVDSLGVSPYVQHAPRQLVNSLQQETQKFDGLCTQLEQQILRAIAVLERDALKAAGLPLPQPLANASDSKAEDTQDEAMDDAFFNSSLFGDTPANSRPTTSSGLVLTNEPIKSVAQDSVSAAKSGKENALGLSLPMPSTSMPASAPMPLSSNSVSEPFATGATTAQPSTLGKESAENTGVTNFDINALLAGTMSSSATDQPDFSSSIGDADMQAMLQMIADANVPPQTSNPSAAPTTVLSSTAMSSTPVSTDVDLSGLLNWSSQPTSSAVPTNASTLTAVPESTGISGLGSIDFSTFDFSSNENLDELLNSFGTLNS